MATSCDGEPLRAADVAALERRIGRPIPAAYRDFLLRHNGGQIEPSGFSFVDAEGPNESDVHTLLGVSKEDAQSIEWNLETLAGRIPDDLFPIADDPLGNLILIGATGADSGKIFFWDHELESEPATRDNVFLIANSFEEFLAMLHE